MLFSPVNLVKAPVANCRGLTFFEMLVAMILLVLVSALLYSVVNMGIRFSDKGDKLLRAEERHRAFTALFHRQLQGTVYSLREKRLKLTLDGGLLTLVTTAPLLNRENGLVLAVYDYDRRDEILYYTEKLDFYNPDYQEDFRPDHDEMLPLVEELEDFEMSFEESTGVFTIVFEGDEYEIIPRCWRDEEDG